jgi:uncharacterized membrane protein
MTLRTFVLFLHVMVAIMAFGPTFVFPFIGAAGGKEPEHGNFALRLSVTIGTRLVIPLAVAMPLLGLWLIFLGDWDLWSSEWLVISIGIYIVTFFFAVLVLNRTGRKLVHMTAGPPPKGAGGPPPEMQRLVKRQKLGGMFTALAVASIVLLMVWKPDW